MHIYEEIKSTKISPGNGNRHDHRLRHDEKRENRSPAMGCERLSPNEESMKYHPPF